ncbi:MAG: phosphoserine transaminase [Alphaproteobacteria bacterium]|nr:phosphoserine transaminase [Alphaproteobacteria bacterium]
MKPTVRPARPFFSSGPCAKRPGWSPDILKNALAGRSHRSAAGKARIGEVISLTAGLLRLPAGWRVGIVPASDTGAVEMALWSLLGPRGIDVLAWESFGSDWVHDVLKELRLKDVRSFTAPYGALPDLGQASPERDVVFTWNGTTSGVRVPNGDWISDARTGLTIVDATSAVFAMDLPWPKIDVATFSWQKVLGGEAQHGILILGPRAVARLESYTPSWPMPKIFRMTKGGKLVAGIFEGETINTPSMLCVEDALDALRWVQEIGGLAATIKRSEANLAAVAEWASESTWAALLAEREETRSCTSICLKVTDPWFATRDTAGQAALIKRATSLLEKEGVAFDIGAYRDAPPGFRIWGGATVEHKDVAAVLPWLDWAYASAKDEASQ